MCWSPRLRGLSQTAQRRNVEFRYGGTQTASEFTDGVWHLPRQLHLPPRSDDINQKLTLPTFVVAEMVNPGCDGSHKNRDLLSRPRGTRENGIVVMCRKPPNFIALWAGLYEFHTACQRDRTRHQPCRLGHVVFSHVGCGTVPRRNCMALVPAAKTALQSFLRATQSVAVVMRVRSRRSPTRSWSRAARRKSGGRG